MIKGFNDLIYYLKCDRVALNKSGFPRFFGDEVWKFQVLLRFTEFFINVNRWYLKPFEFFFRYFKYSLGVKLGFSIPNNTFGPGLRIAHYGFIVVNSECRIGSNCTVHAGVNIGKNLNSIGAPKLGNNIYIGPGVKIFGDIELADYIKIGANSVVNRSFNESGVTIVGIPARKLASKYSN
ncbi:serine acetyltransferase [Shewanella basaltis]|uniref:serine O-acetyltransferase n=1 Tax=Shewanella basaltis TaxID=472183 RepID=UPI0020106FA0|nr:serine acetyltransferase [Shewanella basaltis]MCL1112985.1 serine acetyltransferase [Shewanella basaltis]